MLLSLASEVIRGLTAEGFVHFECWLKVCRIVATDRTECGIWASRSTNQLWFVDEEFAVTACSIWCGSVLPNSESRLFLSLPTTHFLQLLLLSLWPPDQLFYLLYCLSRLPHTIPYAMYKWIVFHYRGCRNSCPRWKLRHCHCLSARHRLAQSTNVKYDVTREPLCTLCVQYDWGNLSAFSGNTTFKFNF